MGFFNRMLAKLKMLVLKRLLALEQDAFDPTQCEDPLALEIDWTALVGGGSNFRTHRLVQVHADRIELRSTWGAKCFYLFFLAMGLFIMSAIPFTIISRGHVDVGILFPLLFGGPFLGIGGYMLYRGTIPIVFDKHAGYFWKSRKTPDRVMHMDAISHYTTLENIHAIQLISEYCSGDKTSFYSYELNLVLDNGDRLSVVDHGKQSEILLDSEILAEFLQVPVWDAL